MKASELYDILTELAQAAPHVGRQRQLREVIALCAAEGCKSQGGTFGNLFSQVDFVCKKHGLKGQRKWAIQTARRRSSLTTPPSQEEWLYDLKAVSIFVQMVFDEDVPGTLLPLLPLTLQPMKEQPVINRRYMRCIVRTFDSQMITADTEEGEITVDYATAVEGHQLTYLYRVLREGMQLNLLDCHVSEDHHYLPMLVVVEPDFLLDISSLAACFTAYGHHPLLYTVNRLKPRPNTQATLLGNFAGTALDDIIYHPEVTTQQSLERSYREQAERFSSCRDFNRSQFEHDAEVQMHNIRESISVLSQDFQITNSLLEPSFICERLGLQGRVDLMMADMSLLVEQKSGKNMKIERQSHDSHGVQREDHYVQLLLYYGIFRYNFGKSDSQVDTRLLYSRYEPQQGLVAVNYYQTLFRDAIQLRNQVVATELLIARDGFGRIRPLLTPEVIYQGVMRDGFFQHYVLPETTALQQLYAGLSPLELAYYDRMMTFVYREQVAQKLGSSEQTLHHSGGCNSDLWLLPLSEKQEQGNIILQMTIVERRQSEVDGGFDIIRFALPPSVSSTEGNSNFRAGDMVYVYQYADQPDVRSSILYKGTLHAINDTHLVVALNNGQQNPDIFVPSQNPWAMEHGSSDTGTASNIRSLHQFISADPHRRQLLLGQRAPMADTSLTLSQRYSAHYDDILLRVKQARDFFLLVGPPGTGKTSMALRFMVLEELHAGGTLLLMAYTNQAVGEIRQMLKEAGLASDERIVTGTTSMMLARPHLMDDRHFSLCIVDEASQVLEPGLIGLLSSEQIDRFVLIGDHKQLPAVVQQRADESRVDDPLLHRIGLTDCRQSLFQRLYHQEQTAGRSQFIGTLDHQGRMHPEVARFANEHFYHTALQPVPVAHQLEPATPYPPVSDNALDRALTAHRMLFLPVVPQRPIESVKSNPDEARLVADVVLHVCRFYDVSQFDADKTLGIIVPYRNQIATIRQALHERQWPFADRITIDTVERYQGSQRDVIIYSFTVSRLFQLDFLTASTFTDTDGQVVDRKLNVALTRARRQTILVGNPLILRQNALFRQLIDESLPGPGATGIIV